MILADSTVTAAVIGALALVGAAMLPMFLSTRRRIGKPNNTGNLTENINDLHGRVVNLEAGQNRILNALAELNRHHRDAKSEGD